MSLKRVSAFLTQNNPLYRNQSSFRSGHSTETALLSVVEALRLANADSKSPILILQDLSSAFDTVNHQILLSTLLIKGISGTAHQWFESYLSNRSFNVSWRGKVYLCLHGLTRFCHSETLLFISCWWHSTLPLIPSWWSDDSCSHLSFQHSASEWRITVPSQRGTKSLSQTFKLNVPSWWNDLPNSIRAAEFLPIFKNRLKTHLFHLYVTL